MTRLTLTLNASLQSLAHVTGPQFASFKSTGSISESLHEWAAEQQTWAVRAIHRNPNTPRPEPADSSLQRPQLLGVTFVALKSKVNPAKKKLWLVSTEY